MGENTAFEIKGLLQKSWEMHKSKDKKVFVFPNVKLDEALRLYCIAEGMCDT
jgi:hypothetical protein